MNILELSDEFTINMDYVVSMTVVDLPDEQGNLRWAIAFKTCLVDNVKTFPVSPDEDEYETSHSQLKEYTYDYEISPLYNTYDDILKVLKGINAEFGFKKEKVVKEKRK